jgi:hypothetical protein
MLCVSRKRGRFPTFVQTKNCRKNEKKFIQCAFLLEEKNEIPKEYSESKVESKGFYDPITVQDFPIRGKKVFLNIRRRRWVLKDEDRYVSRNWKLVAQGSRMTQEFASFLKELY